MASSASCSAPRSRRRDLALAAIVARVLQPGSKLATARGLSPQSATSSLGALLGLGPVRGNEMLDMLDWLLGRDVSRKKVDKHFAIEVTDAEIRWSRKQDKINAEAQLDGIYVIRTSLQSSALGAPEAVEAYKSLAHVERAFRSLKTAQLALRQSPVEKAQVSASTKAKAASKQTPEGLPVHSFQTLLADLGTLMLNEVTLPDAPQHPFPMVAKPTPLQAKAFDLLGVDPGKFVASKLAG